MRPLHHFLFVIVLLALTLASCGPQSAQTESSTSSSTAAVPVTGPESTPALTGINLGGPQMAVGSTWQYVDGSTLVAVPAGEFVRGDGGDDRPIQTIYLDDFWIYQTEVTNQQYALCVALGLCTAPSDKFNPNYTDAYNLQHPVVGVTWEQAQKYCESVGARLQTEAEWEKTARGPDGNIYPWGDAEPGCDLLNFNQCIGNLTQVFDYPAGKSYYDALDMAGNVFEWTADWYSKSYYASSPSENPLGPETGEVRAVRGSSFHSDIADVPSASRFFAAPTEKRRDLGFRCVVEDPAYYAPACETLPIYITVGGQPVQAVTPGSCPGLDANELSHYCIGGVPYTNVDITQGANYSTWPASYSCSPAGIFNNMQRLACTGTPNSSFQLTVEISCTPPNFELKCGPGFSLDSGSNLCVYNGGQGPSDQCPAGYAYDTNAQCCQVQVGGQYALPECDQGTYYNLVTKTCDPIVTFGKSKKIQVNIASCGGGDGGGCNIDPASCMYGFNASQCCCTSPTGGGCSP